VKYLQLASAQNLSLKAGGTKQTLELHRRAVERYEAQLSSSSSSEGSTDSSKQKTTKSNGKVTKLPPRLSEDPEFLKIIEEVSDSHCSFTIPPLTPPPPLVGE
jgi:hypothetical protein